MALSDVRFYGLYLNLDLIIQQFYLFAIYCLEKCYREYRTVDIGQHILLRIPDIALRAKLRDACRRIGVNCVYPFEYFIAGRNREYRKHRKQYQYPFRADKFFGKQNLCYLFIYFSIMKNFSPRRTRRARSFILYLFLFIYFFSSRFFFSSWFIKQIFLCRLLIGIH